MPKKPKFRVGKLARITNLVGTVTAISGRTITMNAGLAEKIILYRDEVKPLHCRKAKRERGKE